MYMDAQDEIRNIKIRKALNERVDDLCCQNKKFLIMGDFKLF